MFHLHKNSSTLEYVQLCLTLERRIGTVDKHKKKDN